jgi:RNA polymerase sigma factor (sigma-70 family)
MRTVYSPYSVPTSFRIVGCNASRTASRWSTRFSTLRHGVRNYNWWTVYFCAHETRTNCFRREEFANLLDHSTNTTQLQAWFARMRSGDPTAREELLRSTGERLERLARKMLKGYPAVKRWVQTDDVLQNAILRLLRALQEVQPGSVREFYGLAAEQMRRELLDLARHYYGPQGLGANHASDPGGESAAPWNPPERTEGTADLERWSAFHQEVANLPAEEREVISLVFYHGWEQRQVAELMGIAVRTVQRRWQAAMIKLHSVLRGEASA